MNAPNHPWLELLQTQEPAALRPGGGNRGVLSVAEIDRALARMPAGAAKRSELFQAGAYLWHDHLDQAHAIVQDIDDADGALIHAILHRREPDYSNAKYWFRRVGRHGAYNELAAKARVLLETAGESKLASVLLPNGVWDPMAFVDAVAEALRSKNANQTKTIICIQRAEFEAMFAEFARRA